MKTRKNDHRLRPKLDRILRERDVAGARSYCPTLEDAPDEIVLAAIHKLSYGNYRLSDVVRNQSRAWLVGHEGGVFLPYKRGRWPAGSKPVDHPAPPVLDGALMKHYEKLLGE